MAINNGKMNCTTGKCGARFVAANCDVSTSFPVLYSPQIAREKLQNMNKVSQQRQ
jgi:hypothetical protein